MKKIILILLLPNFAMSQSTPSQQDFTQGISQPNMLSVVGDTVDFELYPTGTVITNQYQYLGVVFSGAFGSGNPDVYDYGATSYTRVLKSDNWYNPIKVSFVDTANALLYDPVSHIEFDNPENVSGDYIIIDVYDTVGVVVFHGTSFSPQHFTINLGGNNGAYMILDDSMTTAYVVDNIFVSKSTTGIEETVVNNKAVCYPNPFINSTQIFFNNDISIHNATLLVTDISGSIVKTVDHVSGNQLEFFRRQLSSGMYFLKLMMDGKLVSTGKLLIL